MQLFDLNDSDAIEDGLLERRVTEVYEEVTGKSVPEGTKYLRIEVGVEDPDDATAEVELPPIRVRL